MPGGHGPGLVPQVEAELLLGLRGELFAALRDAELGAGEAEDEEERGCSQQSHGRQVNDYDYGLDFIVFVLSTSLYVQLA